MTLAAAALLVVAGLWAYSNSFSGVFVFDDIISIAENPNIKSVWPLTRSMWAPRDVTVSGRPVASFTLALNYAVASADARDSLRPPPPDSPPEAIDRFQRNVWGYHAFNLAVHLLAGLALFGVVRRSLLTVAGRPTARTVADAVRQTGSAGLGKSDALASAATPIAFVVALLWLVHPLQTQSVTYIVQRVESLMGLFFLLTLYAAIRAGEGGTRRRWWAATAVIACALGMGTKEVMVTAPLAVVLWDHLIARKVAGRRPLYAALAATWVIAAALLASSPRAGSVGFGLGGWTWWSYLATQAGVIVHYLRLAFIPSSLVFDYDWPRVRSIGEVVLPGLVLAVLLALSCHAALRRRAMAFPAGCFFLILAPTSSVLPIATEVAAEHRMYLPLAAVIAITVIAIYMVGRCFATNRSRRQIGLVAALVVVTSVTVAFGWSTRARNRDYWSDEALMGDTARKRPANARARVGYGASLLAARRYEEAEAELNAATRLQAPDKTIAQAHMYLGSAVAAQGRIAEGVPHLLHAISMDPTLGEAHAMLGEAFAGEGRHAMAASHFASAVAVLPDNPAVLRRVAWLLATSPDDRVRNGARALELAGRAVSLTGRQDVLSLESLAAAHAEQGRFRAAADAAREALALAHAQGNAAFLAVLQRDLAQFEAGQKLRDPVK